MATISSYPKSPALLLAVLILIEVATSVAVVSLQGCSADLIRRVLACLSYIAYRPYNLPSVLASLCCNLFTSAFHTGSATCLCHLILQPSLLGFPLNITQVLALSSVCPGAMNLYR
ncbi:Bifunctional inhibitor/plant lipid transfer protein/seed storage helical domain [Macleaya cordata]|uniref:Bifunctional inhibitor/plant lipid transfer protein/seed storage helical domain n=1 Tax=Macleaya cordata TaxID=56857 RepID=A0A200QY11_MACCD|nr:Bifunctional inhibitor/plant lipid transfer protein/seed storage helical domain [Macleaya cordata]